MELDKHYPRWIYKDGEKPFIVQTPFQHAEWYNKGWSGPPIFSSEIKDLEDRIEQTETELKQMKERLSVLKAEGRQGGEEEEEKKEEKEHVHVCTVCGKEFKTAEGLTGHSVVHRKGK